MSQTIGGKSRSSGLGVLGIWGLRFGGFTVGVQGFRLCVSGLHEPSEPNAPNIAEVII